MVSRHLHFIHAAQAICLTQGAGRRPIFGLERQRSYPLFKRHARGSIVTERLQTLVRLPSLLPAGRAMTARFPVARSHPAR
ncbi:LysR family transcriptional regulator [Lonsdalea populi]|uniref:LysR family transcriptional regulator n=1 Tax=Lonsdalea populi TaxID=1172565 RepID=UPI0021AC6017|nr:LysR family transcriptional regulator [Lonsdalea populi]